MILAQAIQQEIRSKKRKANNLVSIFLLIFKFSKMNKSMNSLSQRDSIIYSQTNHSRPKSFKSSRVKISRGSKIEQNFETHEQNFGTHEQKFETHDQKFGTHEQKSVTHEQKFVTHEQKFVTHKQKFETHKQKFETHEQKFETHEPTPKFQPTSPRSKFLDP